MMESIAMGKGLYLRPYKIGSGLKLRLHNEQMKKIAEKNFVDPAKPSSSEF